MKFQLKFSEKTNFKNLKTECLILTTSCLKKVNFPKTTLQYLNQIIKQEQLDLHKSILLFKVPEITASRLLIISTGKHSQLSETQFLEISKIIANYLNKSDIQNAAIYIEGGVIKNQDLDWQLYQTSFNIANHLYYFDKYKSKKKSKSKIRYIDFIVDEKFIADPKAILQQSMAVNNACTLVKDLANTPPNVCNPGFLAKTAIELKRKSSKVKINILEKKDLQKLNMGAFLAVAQGSTQPPKLICLEYNGIKSFKNNPPIVLIGKGITFDTGGNSIKPAHSMIGMKFDMCGAATILGIINFAIEMQLKLNLVGIIAAAENMPGRHASRPDDVVTTMSGMTVEILNTDAEGRLILCEAITYCDKFNPKAVIDIATLTGSCAATFGNHYSGLFSNNQELADQLIAASNKAHDKIWQLPITEEYHKQLDSDIADVANIGSGQAGSITAACFLAKFATKYKWAHLDIAGTAYYPEGKITRSPTGRCLPMLAEYLMAEELKIHNKKL